MLELSFSEKPSRDNGTRPDRDLHSSLAVIAYSRCNIRVNREEGFRLTTCEWMDRLRFSGVLICDRKGIAGRVPWLLQGTVRRPA